jgi:hypothetical protein
MAVVPAHTSEFPRPLLQLILKWTGLSSRQMVKRLLPSVLAIATVDKKPELSFIGGLTKASQALP